jgi:hypothetical protein
MKMQAGRWYQTIERDEHYPIIASDSTEANKLIMDRQKKRIISCEKTIQKMEDTIRKLDTKLANEELAYDRLVDILEDHDFYLFKNNKRTEVVLLQVCIALSFLLKKYTNIPSVRFWEAPLMNIKASYSCGLRTRKQVVREIVGTLLCNKLFAIEVVDSWDEERGKKVCNAEKIRYRRFDFSMYTGKGVKNVKKTHNRRRAKVSRKTRVLSSKRRKQRV